MNNPPDGSRVRERIFSGVFFEEPSKEACDPRESSGRENSSSSFEEERGRHEPEGKKTNLRRKPQAITVGASAGPGQGRRGETPQSAQA